MKYSPPQDYGAGTPVEALRKMTLYPMTSTTPTIRNGCIRPFPSFTLRHRERWMYPMFVRPEVPGPRDPARGP